MKKQLNVSEETNFKIEFYIDKFHDICFILTNNSNFETFETYFAGYEVEYWSDELRKWLERIVKGSKHTLLMYNAESLEPSLWFYIKDNRYYFKVIEEYSPLRPPFFEVQIINLGSFINEIYTKYLQLLQDLVKKKDDNQHISSWNESLKSFKSSKIENYLNSNF
ncbi:MAG: hypothetical protein ISP71_03035 [Flavobacteriales bacterium]|nr:hypothetical protein [Flavobacteriales bacterium]